MRIAEQLKGSNHQEGHRAIVAEAIDRLAIAALHHEVSVTPKPGLVDCDNCGAHSDMDYRLFQTSIAALKGYFGQCFISGNQSQSHTEGHLLQKLQTHGQAAEARMYSATNKVNTHKGAIFSLGLLSGAIGFLIGQEEMNIALIRSTVSLICRGLCDQAFAEVKKKPIRKLTNGERVYLKYGLTGARGEAESGFPTVANIALPKFRFYLREGFPVNDASVETLLYLIAYTDDTNIIARHDRQVAAYARMSARKCLEHGGYLCEGGVDRLKKMDREFIRKNISPGGSADLIAVTYFLFHVNRQFGPAQQA